MRSKKPARGAAKGVSEPRLLKQCAHICRSNLFTGLGNDWSKTCALQQLLSTRNPNQFRASGSVTVSLLIDNGEAISLEELSVKFGDFLASRHVNSARALSNEFLGSGMKQEPTKTVSSFGFSDRNVTEFRAQAVAGDCDALNPSIINESD